MHECNLLATTANESSVTHLSAKNNSDWVWWFCLDKIEYTSSGLKPGPHEWGASAQTLY